LRLFRRRHAAVDDHALGKADGCLNVYVLADDVLDMGEAMAGGILDAPCLAGRGPLHFRPHLAADIQVVSLGVDPVTLFMTAARAAALPWRLCRCR
jgi:hypothetical protein